MHRSSWQWSLNVLFSIVFSSCRTLNPWFSNVVGLTVLRCHFHFALSCYGANFIRPHHNCDLCVPFVFVVHFPPAKSFGNRVTFVTIHVFISLIQLSFSPLICWSSCLTQSSILFQLRNHFHYWSFIRPNLIVQLCLTKTILSFSVHCVVTAQLAIIVVVSS